LQAPAQFDCNFSTSREQGCDS